MKNFTTSLLLMACSAIVPAQRYGVINAKLDKIIEERAVERGIINADLTGKKFIIVKNDNSVVLKKIIQFENSNRITVIEVSDNTNNSSNSSKIYTGDMVKNDNNISVRADKLEGKPIAVPYTVNFILQKKQNRLYLLNINNNERWMDTTQ